MGAGAAESRRKPIDAGRSRAGARSRCTAATSATPTAAVPQSIPVVARHARKQGLATPQNGGACSSYGKKKLCKRVGGCMWSGSKKKGSCAQVRRRRNLIAQHKTHPGHIPKNSQ